MEAGDATQTASPPAPPPGHPDGTGVTATLDRFQRRHTWAGFPLAVVYKYVDDMGGYLAALLTYYAFVSLFPLLLLLTTVLGIVLRGNPDLQARILDSALAQFPVVGQQLGEPQGLGGSTAGIVIGAMVSLYGALGVAQAFQYATNTAWRVPRNQRPNPILSRVRGLLILGTAGLAILGTTVLSTLASTSIGSLGWFSRAFFVVASVVVNALVFTLAFRISTTRALSVRDVAPGAAITAVAWLLLQTFGVAYVTSVVQGRSATNGVFAIVLGLLAYLYLSFVVLVLATEVNVVRVDHLHPRALLTPFTDDVSLTRGDKRAYAGAAEAQRSKGFQTIDVRFDRPPPQQAPTDDGATTDAGRDPERRVVD
ncbi:MAG TPA: YihY/virulence factor BrkB family protein [Dermatophilaceae bacterium]|nr:YihY/virulence factor BrkB family protein [Dermatophilaceae bacterium]